MEGEPMFEVKNDCFGYDKTKKKCKMLKDLYCSKSVCEFYKTKEQITKERRKVVFDYDKD
jgi:hypothetical protein